MKRTLIRLQDRVGLPSFLAGLMHLTGLRHLQLKSCNVTSEVPPGNPNVHQDPDSYVQIACRSLVHMPHLQHLDLTYNDFGPSAFHDDLNRPSFDRCLTHLTSLTGLKLEYCNLNDVRLQRLARGLPALTALESLCLAGNDFNNESARLVCQAVDKHPLAEGVKMRPLLP